MGLAYSTLKKDLGQPFTTASEWNSTFPIGFCSIVEPNNKEVPSGFVHLKKFLIYHLISEVGGLVTVLKI